MGTKKFLIKVNGNEYEVLVEEVSNDTNTNTTQPVQKTEANKVEEKAVEKKVSKEEKVVNTSGTKINSPMPGTILKINVSVGDIVKKEQVLLILEAMKMENEITSPVDGKISMINVQKGSAVNVNDLLISIE